MEGDRHWKGKTTLHPKPVVACVCHLLRLVPCVLCCERLFTLCCWFFFAYLPVSRYQNYVNAKNFLEKRYQDDMELEDAIHTALLTLREGFEGEMNSNNIEVGVVRNGKFSTLSPSQIQDYLDEAN